MSRTPMSEYFDSEPTKLPPRTDALPGTVRKQMVYAIRVWRLQVLNHPEDAREGEEVPITLEQMREMVRLAVKWNRDKRGRRWKAGVAKRSLMLAVPEIDEEVFKAMVDGRLSFQILTRYQDESLWT